MRVTLSSEKFETLNYQRTMERVLFEIITDMKLPQICNCILRKGLGITFPVCEHLLLVFHLKGFRELMLENVGLDLFWTFKVWSKNQ